jgi:hypothetical protein
MSNAIVVIRAMRSGMVISWLGDEAKISGKALDGFGFFQDNIVGQPITGRLGAFDFEVLGYEQEEDVFTIKRISNQ